MFFTICFPRRRLPKAGGGAFFVCSDKFPAGFASLDAVVFFALLRVGAPCVGINFLVDAFVHVAAGSFHLECNCGVIAELLG